jgi:plasmid maintenance system antidote protein VapI
MDLVTPQIRCPIHNETQLSQLVRRMEQAYLDKLDGNITPDFWTRMQQDWQQEEMRLEQSLRTLGQP